RSCATVRTISSGSHASGASPGIATDCTPCPDDGPTDHIRQTAPTATTTPLATRPAPGLAWPPSIYVYSSGYAPSRVPEADESTSMRRVGAVHVGQLHAAAASGETRPARRQASACTRPVTARLA